MITGAQSAYVAERIVCSDQDYFLWSGLLGEPFLDGDVLSYYDGETVTVVGVPLEHEPQPAAPRLLARVAHWLECEAVCAVNYFGSDDLDLSALLGGDFALTVALDPQPENVDLSIDLADPSVLATPRARKSIRAAQRRGLRVRSGPCEFLRRGHIDLIRRYAQREELSLSDVSYLTNIVTIMRSACTTVFEVDVDGRVAGFAVAHEYFPGKPFLALAAFDAEPPDVADAVYATMIEHYRERGARWLGLGYSIDEGLYRYKMKWGGVRSHGSFYQRLWTRRGCEAVSEGYWACNLLLHKERAG